MQPLSRDAQRVTESRTDADRRLIEDAIAAVYRCLEDGILAMRDGWVDADRLIGMNHNDIRKIVQRKAPDRRGLAIDDVLPIARAIMFANPSLGTRLGAALVDALALQVFPRVSVPDQLRADRLEGFVLAMPLGRQLAAEALGGPRLAIDDKARGDAYEALLRKLSVSEQAIDEVVNGVRR
jgi:hypothetical protein